MTEQRDPRSSTTATEKAAREYVDKQLETMKRYGSAPRDKKTARTQKTKAAK